MSTDVTEDIRREMIAQQQDEGRAALEAKYGNVWSTDEMREDFEAIGFMAPFVVVRRKSDGKKGSLEFQVSLNNRYYHSFQPDSR